MNNTWSHVGAIVLLAMLGLLWEAAASLPAHYAMSGGLIGTPAPHGLLGGK